MSVADPLMLLHCPRCGADHDPEEFAGDEVPRCRLSCADEGEQPTPELEGVFRSDLLDTGRAS